MREVLSSKPWFEQAPDMVIIPQLVTNAPGLPQLIPPIAPTWFVSVHKPTSLLLSFPFCFWHPGFSLWFGALSYDLK
jgi:hypothetical protein